MMHRTDARPIRVVERHFIDNPIVVFRNDILVVFGDDFVCVKNQFFDFFVAMVALGDKNRFFFKTILHNLDVPDTDSVTPTFCCRFDFFFVGCHLSVGRARIFPGRFVFQFFRCRHLNGKGLFGRLFVVDFLSQYFRVTLVLVKHEFDEARFPVRESPNALSGIISLRRIR